MTQPSIIRSWTVPKRWEGDRAFVICGGPSLSGFDFTRLQGERVIVINSSYLVYPRADYLIFSDRRWWDKHMSAVNEMFTGTVVTVTPMSPSDRYKVLERQRSSGLALDPRKLAVWHTTTCGAINLALHLGAKTINLLGLDGQDSTDGRSWHHEDHPWSKNPKRYECHGMALTHVADHLTGTGATAYNANPESAHKMFPYRSIEEMLR